MNGVTRVKTQYLRDTMDKQELEWSAPCSMCVACQHIVTEKKIEKKIEEKSVMDGRRTKKRNP